MTEKENASSPIKKPDPPKVPITGSGERGNIRKYMTSLDEDPVRTTTSTENEPPTDFDD